MIGSRRRRHGAWLAAGLAALLALSSSCSKSESRPGEAKAVATAAAGASVSAAGPCAGCPPAAGQAVGFGRHLAGDARPKVRRTPEEMARTGEKLEGLLAELGEAVEGASSATYDPQAVVDEAGSEVEPLFAWVRDNTRLAPYRGVLRGPLGVLMDRLGNSLDRALLLCDLLGRAGIDAELAHATLPAAQAENLLEQASPPPPRADAPRALTDADREAIEGWGAVYGVDPRALFKTVEDEIARREALARRVSRGESDILPKLLDLTAPLREADPAAETRQAVEDLRDHWWVRAETDAGTIDLDPSLPGAPPGRAPAEASETVRPKGLDEALYHRIVLRAVVERWEAGRLETREVLRREIFPTDVAGQRIVLGHAPAGWPATLEDLLELKDRPRGLHATVLGQASWTPVLTIGEDRDRGSAFDDAGRAVGESGGGRSAGGLFGGLGGALTGESGGEKGPEAEKQASVLTAEWIEYEVLSPGRAPKKVRRELFDLIGPAARSAAAVPRPEAGEAARMKRSLALLGRTEILPVVCRWSADYARYLADGHLLAAQEPLLSLFDPDVLREPSEVLERLGEMDRLPVALYRLAAASPVDGGYIGAPNILSRHSLFWEDGEGFLRHGSAIDIAVHETAAWPGAADRAFRTRLAQGVRDSFWESVLSGPAGGDDPLTRFAGEVAGKGGGWLAAGPGDTAALSRADLPPDLAARLRAAAGEGAIVAFPRINAAVDGRPALIWWRIDARTGEALVHDERGWGQAMTSYVQRVELVLQIKGWIELAVDIFKCAVTGVVAAVGAGPQSNVNEFLTCVQLIICNQLYSQFEDYCDLETNWTNFILKQLAGYLAGELCDILMDDDTWGGAVP